MKHSLIAATALLWPGLAAAEVFVITDDAEGVPKLETLESPSLSEVPEINGEANDGFTYAQLWSGMEGVTVFEGRIALAGRIVSHDGPETYVAYIVSGGGTMGNDAPDGSTDSTFD